jgi:hypothetical protein
MPKLFSKSGPSFSKAFFTADWLGADQRVSSVAATQSLVMRSMKSFSRGAHNSLLAPIAGVLLVSAGVIAGSLQSPAQAIERLFSFQFKADGEDVQFNLEPGEVLQMDPVTNFEGYKLKNVYGTDGGKPIIALLPSGTNLMPSIVDGKTTYKTDNLFNPLPDVNSMPAPNQLSIGLSAGGLGGGFAYKVDEGSGVFKDYQFYYGLRPGSAVADYQGCVRIHGQPGCGSVNISNFSTQEVPGPLPILGAAAAFGWSRKLRKRLKSSKPEVISTTAV